MQTQILCSPEDAAQVVRAGGLCAFPTETVYGLAADATNPEAISRLFAAKGRPSDNPLIVHIASVDQLDSAACKVTRCGQDLMDAFTPGPLTVVLEKNDKILASVTASLPSVGIRIPASTIARDFLRLAGLPIAAPSANRSGRPSCTTWESVLEDMRGRIDAILQGPSCEVGIESTVVDCTTETPCLLRPGGISFEALVSICPTIQTSSPSRHAASPGLRHPHYQPDAKVWLFRQSDEIVLPSLFESCEEFWEGKLETADRLAPNNSLVGPRKGRDYEKPVLLVGLGDTLALKTTELGQLADKIIAFGSIEEYSRKFYETLRQADRDGFANILLLAVPPVGLGRSLLDRQQRASSRN